MGVVVTLMTLLVVLLSGLTAGLAHQSTSAITGLPVDHVAFAAPGSDEQVSFTDSRVDEAQWEQWRAVPGVTSAEPLGVTTTRVSADEGTAALAAFGAPLDSDLAPEGTQIRSGEVILSTGAADSLGAEAGESVDVAGQRLRIADVAGDDWYSHTPVMWTSLGDWQSLNQGAPGTATVVALSTGDDADLAAADERLGTRTVSRSDALSAIGSYTSENGSLQLMRGMLFGISALVIGAFFTVWTIQRSGDIAVLKALGASNRYLLRDALGQAILLLAVGTALGVALAAGLGALASGSVPFVLSAGSILFPASIMIVLGAVGAALSVRRITSVDPLTALGSAR